MPLRLVPQQPPSQAEKVRARVRALPKPDGLLQCNRCGGRTMLTAINGAYRENGRITGGSVIADKECADCWKQGIRSPMVTSIKPAT